MFPTTPSNTISGQIVEIQGNLVSIQTENGIATFNVPPTVDLTKNGMTTSPDQVQVKDYAALTTSPTGQVTDMMVVSGAAVRGFALGVPVLLMLLVIGVLWYFMRKQSKPYIKTTIATAHDIRPTRSRKD